MAENKHGGKRPGAGRKTNHQLRLEKEELEKQLEESTELVIGLLGSRTPKILTGALDLADGGDKAMMKFVIELFFKHGFSAEEVKTAFDGVFEKWSREHSEESSTGTTGRHPRNAEYPAIVRAV